MAARAKGMKMKNWMKILKYIAISIVAIVLVGFLFIVWHVNTLKFGADSTTKIQGSSSQKYE